MWPMFVQICGAFVFGAMSFTDKLSSGVAIALIQQFSPRKYIRSMHRVPNNTTILIVNNFYKLEPILIIFSTLYAETTGFLTHLKYLASPYLCCYTTWENTNHKTERFCMLSSTEICECQITTEISRGLSQILKIVALNLNRFYAAGYATGQRL